MLNRDIKCRIPSCENSIVLRTTMLCNKHHSRLMAGRMAPDGSLIPKPPIVAPCEYCGKIFTADGNGRARKFCSIRCRDLNYKPRAIESAIRHAKRKNQEIKLREMEYEKKERIEKFKRHCEVKRENYEYYKCVYEHYKKSRSYKETGAFFGYSRQRAQQICKMYQDIPRV